MSYTYKHCGVYKDQNSFKNCTTVKNLDCFHILTQFLAMQQLDFIIKALVYDHAGLNPDYGLQDTAA
jgi:hypothetical protein